MIKLELSKREFEAIQRELQFASERYWEEDEEELEEELNNLLAKLEELDSEDQK